MVFGSFASTADESHLEGSVGNVSPVFCFRFRSVFGRFGLGFRWCLAFSHPLRTKSIFVFGPCFGTCLSSGLQLCRAGGYFFLVFRGFRKQRFASFPLPVSSVFGRFGLGFRWCLAFSHPLPTRAIFVFVFRGFRRQRFASFLLSVS